MIPHSRPTVGAQDQAALAAVVASGQVAQGPRVKEFERAVASYVGVAAGVAVHSGTAAVELALLAIGIGPGDEVILPSYVCAGPWLAIVRAGAQPRIVDIDPMSYALDPAHIKRALTPLSRAIIVPHMFGLPADLTQLQTLGVPLIEDCAQTLGATERGRHVGRVGQVTVCSFYATKLLCTGEGGMLLSNDRTILDKARALREYDEGSTLNRGAFNRKMTDLQAAMGVSQLERLPSFLARRAEIAEYYSDALKHPAIDLPAVPSSRTHIYYRYVVRVWRQGFALEDLLARLESCGVQCRRPIFRPLHHYLHVGGCPASEEAYLTALSIPIYPSLTNQEMARVVEILLREVDRASG